MMHYLVFSNPLALREGAPKMKAKRARSNSASFSSEEDHKYTVSDESYSPSKVKKERISVSSSSSFERTMDDREDEADGKGNAINVKSDIACKTEPRSEETLLIKPSARLLRRAKVEPISVDELPTEERELYLRDFFPPDPAIPPSETKPHASSKPQKYTSDDSPPMVSV